MVAGILAKSSWQYYKKHPLQLVLSVLGIMLGVGIVTAVLITNHSSQRAFALSTEALHGRTTHQITAASGISNSIYTELRKAQPDLVAAPVIEGFAAIDNTVFSVLGLDPFAELPFNRAGGLQGASRGGNDLSNKGGSSSSNNSNQSDSSSAFNPALIFESGLVINASTNQRLQLPLNSPVEIQSGTTRREVKLLGEFNTSNPAAGEGLLVGDIALVQWLLNRGNKIDRIDLILTDAEAENLQDTLPATLKLTKAASRRETMQAMTRGFQINLTAMSLLSLVVGAFLIHNTMTFAVLQRRELFAIKRITGLSAQAVWISIVAEALAISLFASLIGLLLGYFLAHGLIQLTTQTINDLYFVLHVQTVRFSPWLAIGGLALGMGTSLLAASIAATDAATTNPTSARSRSLKEQQTRHWLPLLATIGSVVILLGIILSLIPLKSLLIGFAALMLVIVGYGLCLPWLSYKTGHLLSQLLSGTNTIIAMAAGSISRNISRTGLAIAALSVAVSSTFGVNVMIGSFRDSVDQWLGTTLHSDVFVSTSSTVSNKADTALSDKLLARVRAVDGVQSISTGLTRNITSNIGRFDMLILKPHNDKADGMTFLSDNQEAGWQQFLHDDAVLISEPISTKYALNAGDNITLFTPQDGDRVFVVAGVLRDYGSSHGKLTMSRRTYNRHWTDETLSTLGILFKKGVDATEDIRNALADSEQPLRIHANRTIHENSLAVFDRTFEVTRVLHWLTIGVAFVGVFSALLALHMERARELGVLRATGATQLQLALLIGTQTAIMGLMAGLFAIPLGWIMSEILIHVINLRSFGWSMQSFIPSGAISTTLLLAIVSALLAGTYPAWKLSQSNIANTLRDE